MVFGHGNALSLTSKITFLFSAIHNNSWFNITVTLAALIYEGSVLLNAAQMIKNGVYRHESLYNTS